MSFSLQRVLGRPGEFFGVLAESARECCSALHAVQALLKNPGAKDALESFANARRRDKELTQRMETMLTRVFVTPIEREDLESISQALYVIPKTVEKFAERYVLVSGRLQGHDFAPHAAMLERAALKVLEMVEAMRENRKLTEFQRLNRELIQIEYTADEMLYASLRRIYTPGFPALEGIILKDLLDILEAVMEHCRAAGEIIQHVTLKNS